MVRKPIVSGQFYPSEELLLRGAVEAAFKEENSPGDVPGSRGTGKVAGVITPHAGYMFSGAGAAWCFKEIGESAFPDTYVIIGVNHSGPVTCASDEDWETPMGIVKCDKELVSALEEKGLPVDNDQHAHEHSIEVQLPFLQFVSEDKKEDLKIVCIMVADSEHSKWANVISDAVSSLGRSVVYICSSDFTHYGQNYGYVPFEDDVPANLKKLDMGAVEQIKKLDADSFLGFVEEKGATICGRCGIAVLIDLMKGKKAELLHYYTSGNILGDYGNAVGYASIIFR